MDLASSRLRRTGAIGLLGAACVVLIAGPQTARAATVVTLDVAADGCLVRPLATGPGGKPAKWTGLTKRQHAQAFRASRGIFDAHRTTSQCSNFRTHKYAGALVRMDADPGTRQVRIEVERKEIAGSQRDPSQWFVTRVLPQAIEVAASPGGCGGGHFEVAESPGAVRIRYVDSTRDRWCSGPLTYSPDYAQVLTLLEPLGNRPIVLEQPPVDRAMRRFTCSWLADAASAAAAARAGALRSPATLLRLAAVNARDDYFFLTVGNDVVLPRELEDLQALELRALHRAITQNRRLEVVPDVSRTTRSLLDFSGVSDACGKPRIASVESSAAPKFVVAGTMEDAVVATVDAAGKATAFVDLSSSYLDASMCPDGVTLAVLSETFAPRARPLVSFVNSRTARVTATRAVTRRLVPDEAISGSILCTAPGSASVSILVAAGDDPWLGGVHDLLRVERVRLRRVGRATTWSLTLGERAFWYRSKDDGVASVDARTGVHTESSISTGHAGELQLSPDGKTLAVVRWGKVCMVPVRVAFVRGGHRCFTRRPGNSISQGAWIDSSRFMLQVSARYGTGDADADEPMNRFEVSPKGKLLKKGRRANKSFQNAFLADGVLFASDDSQRNADLGDDRSLFRLDSNGCWQPFSRPANGSVEFAAAIRTAAATRGSVQEDRLSRWTDWIRCRLQGASAAIPTTWGR